MFRDEVGMPEWLSDLVGPEYVNAIFWTLGALLVLLVILAIVRLVRGLNSGTFVAGGRNRKTRLSVMDATAVDSHRRLILVRRDDVEHLLLIGGPSDVVVEQNIRTIAPRRPEARELAMETSGEDHVPERAEPARVDPRRAEMPRAEMPRVEAPRPQPARSEPAAMREPELAPPSVPPIPDPRPPVMIPRPPQPQAHPVRANGPQNQAPRREEVRPASDRNVMPASRAIDPRQDAIRSADPRRAEPNPAFAQQVEAPRAASRPPQPQAPQASRPDVLDDDFDDALLNELDLDMDEPAPAATQRPLSLDDEMTRLLGELSSQKR